MWTDKLHFRSSERHYHRNCYPVRCSSLTLELLGFRSAVVVDAKEVVAGAWDCNLGPGIVGFRFVGFQIDTSSLNSSIRDGSGVPRKLGRRVRVKSVKGTSERQVVVWRLLQERCLSCL